MGQSTIKLNLGTDGEDLATYETTADGHVQQVEVVDPALLNGDLFGVTGYADTSHTNSVNHDGYSADGILLYHATKDLHIVATGIGDNQGVTFRVWQDSGPPTTGLNDEYTIKNMNPNGTAVSGAHAYEIIEGDAHLYETLLFSGMVGQTFRGILKAGHYCPILVVNQTGIPSGHAVQVFWTEVSPG